MEKVRLSHKWMSDETNLFYEILAGPVNNFIETLERGGRCKESAGKYLIPLLPNLKKF